MGIFEEIGELASPIAAPLNFIKPVDQFANEGDAGSFMNTLGRGVTNMANNSMFGAARMLPGMLGSDELSAKQKLLFGGLIVGGGAMGAREAHRAWRFANPKGLIRPARTNGVDALTQHGDPNRYMDRSDAAWKLALDRPGMNARQLAIQSADDELGMVVGVRRWKNDMSKDAHAGAVIRRLIDQSEDLAAAQSDLAMFELAMDKKNVVKAFGENGKVRDLWKRLATDPESFASDMEGADKLISYMRQLGDTLEGVNEDFTLGYVGRVDRIDFKKGKVRIHTEHPVNWNDGRTRHESVRSARLQELNVRALAPAGKANLKKLFYAGDAAFDEQAATGTSAFKRLDPTGEGMNLGRNWYPQALKDVISVFKIGKVSDDYKVLFRGERKGSKGTFFTEDREYARRFKKDAGGDGQMVEAPMPAKDDLLDVDNAAQDVFEIGTDRLRAMQAAFESGELPDQGLIRQLERDLKDGVSGESAARIMRTLNTVDKNSDDVYRDLLESKGKSALHLYEADGSRSYFLKERPLEMLDSADREALDRAVASVSFLSEAEDWATNIVKAKRVLDLAGDGIGDPLFQRWLRNGPELMTVKEARASEKEFKRIWKLVKGDPKKGDGFKVGESDMKKVLRLYGGVESVREILNTMNARKQRNFYLNIRYPQFDTPITVDRHAYDAFNGFDAGLQNRPINKSVFDGDEVYDVVADAYRDVAREISEETGKEVLPHQVQAVVWEMWRLQKRASKHREGWKNNDPYMITPDIGQPNVAYEALMGRGALPAHLDVKQALMPVEVLEVGSVKELGATVMGDNVVMSTRVNDTTATSLRNLFPAFVGPDGVAHWASTRAARMSDYEATSRKLREIDNSTTRNMLSSDVANAGGHPALNGVDGVMVTLPEGTKLRRPPGFTRENVVPLGQVTIEAPERLTDRLGIEDFTTAEFADEINGPMGTHQWAVISANLNDEQVEMLIKNLPAAEGAKFKNWDVQKQHNMLYKRLVEKGYKPIQNRGRYFGEDEESFLVFGISHDDAAKFGDEFGQDSVLTNNGFQYNSKVTYFTKDKKDLRSPPPGTFTPSSKTRSGLRGEENRSTTPTRTTNKKGVVVEKDVDWAAHLPELAGDKMSLVYESGKNTTKKGRQVFIPMKDTGRIGAFADELEMRGYDDITIYSSKQDVDGWDRAYEEILDDGKNMIAARFKDGSSINPHGSHIFVRNASGLPRRKMKDYVANSLEVVEPNAGSHGLDGNRLVPDDGSGMFAATIDRDGNINLVGEDLNPAVDLRNAVEGTRDVAKLKTDEGTFSFAGRVAPTEDGAMLRLTNGMRSDAARRDRPVTKFAEDFGFEFDPGYRMGRNETKVLGQEVQDALIGVVKMFMDKHGDAIHRFRLERISVSDSPEPDMLAHTTVGKEGREIVLNKKLWDDPELFNETVKTSRESSYLSPRVPVGPAGVLAHELGHVLAATVRLQENHVQSSSFHKALKEGLGGGRKWIKEAKKVSRTAGTDVDELVAESVSEVLMGTPSPTALKVYGILTQYLDEGFQLDKAVNQF